MATEEEKNEDGAPETPAEQRSRNYWWLSLAFIFLFLAGGGYYALTNMGAAAHKLVSGENYTQLSSNSAAYSGAGALQKSDNFFSSEEPAPLAAGAAGGVAAGSDMLKAAEDRQLLASGADSGAASSAGAQAAADGQPAGSGAMAALASGTFSAKLQARTSGLAGRSGSQASKTTGASGQTEAFEGGAPADGKPSVQRETNAAAAPKKGASTGVLSALKGAFRASFYGARIASHDSARSWIAKTFDATPEYDTAIQYDDKMRSKLDKINPDSIPKFLREQDVSAAEAKTLAAAEVGKPQVDVEGTKQALENDKDYQAKKMAQDMAAGAVDPIGKLFSGGGNTSRNEDETDGAAEGRAFVAPEDEASYGQDQLDEYMSVNGYGAECGCTQTAPCCCLPQNSATNSCPMYGPFLPNDPCGNYTTDLTGDFPPLNTYTQLPA